jgi:hypothetical protein
MSYERFPSSPMDRGRRGGSDPQQFTYHSQALEVDRRRGGHIFCHHLIVPKFFGYPLAMTWLPVGRGRGAERPAPGLLSKASVFGRPFCTPPVVHHSHCHCEDDNCPNILSIKALKSGSGSWRTWQSHKRRVQFKVVVHLEPCAGRMQG